MLSDSSIRRLSITQREMLIAHIDREVDIVVAAPHLIPSRTALMNLGLLRRHPANAIRPRQTALTEAGRHAVSVILGDYADALVRAGYLEEAYPEEPAMMVLQRLKASKRGVTPENPAALAVLMQNSGSRKPTI